jgi:hypothetical protein
LTVTDDGRSEVNTNTTPERRRIEAGRMYIETLRRMQPGSVLTASLERQERELDERERELAERSRRPRTGFQPNA